MDRQNSLRLKRFALFFSISIIYRICSLGYAGEGMSLINEHAKATMRLQTKEADLKKIQKEREDRGQHTYRLQGEYDKEQAKHTQNMSKKMIWEGRLNSAVKRFDQMILDKEKDLKNAGSVFGRAYIHTKYKIKEIKLRSNIKEYNAKVNYYFGLNSDSMYRKGQLGKEIEDSQDKNKELGKKEWELIEETTKLRRKVEDLENKLRIKEIEDQKKLEAERKQKEEQERADAKREAELEAKADKGMKNFQNFLDEQNKAADQSQKADDKTKKDDGEVKPKWVDKTKKEDKDKGKTEGDQKDAKTKTTGTDKGKTPGFASKNKTLAKEGGSKTTSKNKGWQPTGKTKGRTDLKKSKDWKDYKIVAIYAKTVPVEDNGKKFQKLADIESALITIENRGNQYIVEGYDAASILVEKGFFISYKQLGLIATTRYNRFGGYGDNYKGEGGEGPSGDSLFDETVDDPCSANNPDNPCVDFQKKCAGVSLTPPKVPEKKKRRGDTGETTEQYWKRIWCKNQKTVCETWRANGCKYKRDEDFDKGFKRFKASPQDAKTYGGALLPDNN